MTRYLIACGGTGGHLAPGIALAEGLLAQGDTATLLVSGKLIDARLLEKYPHLDFMRIPGVPLVPAPAGLVRFLWSQLRGVGFGLRLVRSSRPAAIVGFGGFTTGAMVIAGVLCGVPVALHESNRVPGRAIRMFGRFARRVYLPPGVLLPGVGVAARRFAALPVRREIVRLPRAEACARLGLDPGRTTLVVLGGSQGASALNAWARRQLPELAAAGVQVCCVIGPGQTEPAPEPGRDATGAAVPAVFLPFCDDMAALLSAADLAVSRAGAGTLAELARCETPAVLVPYPHAADHHQAANAGYFAQQGGALVLDQARLDELGGLVRGLLADPARLARLRAGLRQLDRPGTLDLLLRDLGSLHTRPGRPVPASVSPA
jgi:UDP-N-acetylglucosamine--N-acetylmuramyl-(pentapeptide) pyrophosphoryl-undecaprenol N-acetylglucosamine transferase